MERWAALEIGMANRGRGRMQGGIRNRCRPARALPWPLRLRAATANLTANERHLWTLPYITVESPCDGHSSHDRRGRGAAGGAPEHGKEPRGARLPAGGEAGEVRPVPFR